MASRGSFQKRQKEAARKEKRQSKLDRRQGRAPIAPSLGGYSSTAEEQTEEHDSNVDENENTAIPESADRAHAEAE